MDTTGYVALSRAITLRERLDSIAHNLANVDTPGFRAELDRTMAVPFRTAPRESVSYVQLVAKLYDASEGPIERTGNPLDLAIHGPGFFTVMTADGPAYTRHGHFELDPEGRIVTTEGYALLDENGAPIEVPPGSGPVTVAGDGTISTRAGPLARIRPVSFADPLQLERDAGGLFRSDAPAIPVEEARIVQGALEGSNVRPVHELTRLIETQRGFEHALRMIETWFDLDRRTTERALSARA
ncbi:Flagellar basal-body rod protein FlgF [bacterium HR39]|nr:Flagellar basal-body rod protein FlgF [bacterium HR39]